MEDDGGEGKWEMFLLGWDLLIKVYEWAGDCDSICVHKAKTYFSMLMDTPLLPDIMFCYCMINWKSYAMTYYRQDKAVTGKRFFTVIPASLYNLKLHTPLQTTPQAQMHYISLYK